ncbi:hypothetical protein [Roseimarinus sediminis]|uniref:hypothetical protein n=1 Tax=Roseimarinus sediminis TaxID=1610899 RepID=UPI003D1E003A
MNKIFFFLLFLSLIVIRVDGQELVNEPLYKADVDYHTINFGDAFDQQFFSAFYPGAGKAEAFGRQLFQLYSVPESFTFYRDSLSSQQSFHYYASPNFYFFRNDRPLYFNAGFHFKNIFGWDRVDPYLFSAGGLSTDYEFSDEKILKPGTGKPALYFEMGAGVEYKADDGKYIFLQSSGMFRNMTPIGNRQLGGVRMKF